MSYWFTSDTHFGHCNIMKYCNRPFKLLDEMNSTLIQNWNSRVKENDTVFFLGDFCFKSGSNRGEGISVKASEWKAKLNGSVVFIKGNHDRNNSLKTPIHSMQIIMGGYKMNMVHRPQDVNFDYDINLVGHVHEKWKVKRIYKSVGLYKRLIYKLLRKKVPITTAINVGVDVWKFRPISINEILKVYNISRREL